VIVENPDSADCQVKLDMAVSSRSWAKQQTSNFTFRSDVVVQGRHTTNNAVKNDFVPGSGHADPARRREPRSD
jgi:hypothetical protein